MPNPNDHRASSIPISGATNTLLDRILGKIVMPGPAAPCATWVGAYSHGRKRSTNTTHLRPVIQAGGRGTPVLYVAPTLLRLFADAPPSDEHREAGHSCPCGTRHDAVYACVDLAHLRWVTRDQNEADKRRDDLPVSVDSLNQTD